MGGKGDIDIGGGGGGEPRDDYAPMNSVLSTDFPVFDDGAGEIEEIPGGLPSDGTLYYFQSSYVFNTFPGTDGFFGFSNDSTYPFEGRKDTYVEVVAAGDWFVDYATNRIYSYSNNLADSYVHMCERQVEVLYEGPWTFILDTWPLSTRLPEADEVTPGRFRGVQVVNFNDEYLIAHPRSGGPPREGNLFGWFYRLPTSESQDGGLTWAYMPTTFPTPTLVGEHGSPHGVSELNPPPGGWPGGTVPLAIRSSIYTYSHDGNRDVGGNNIGKYFYWFRRSFGPTDDWEKAENREWWTDYYDAKFTLSVASAWYRWSSPTGMLWGAGIDVMAMLAYRDGGNYFNDTSTGTVQVTDLWKIDGWGLKPAADLSDGSLLWTLSNFHGVFVRAQTFYDFEPFPPTVTDYYIMAGETPFLGGTGQVWNKQGSNAATLAWSSASEPNPSEYQNIEDLLALSAGYMLMIVRYNASGYYYRVYESTDYGQSFQLLSQINFQDLYPTPSVGQGIADDASRYEGFRLLSSQDSVIAFRHDDGMIFLYSGDAGVTWNAITEFGLPDDPWIMSGWNAGDGRVFTEFTGDPILMMEDRPSTSFSELYPAFHKTPGEPTVRFQVAEDLAQERDSVFDAEIRQSDIVGSIITCDSAGFTIRAPHINELRQKFLHLNANVQTGGTNRVNFGIDVSDLPTVSAQKTAVRRDHYYICKRETDKVIGQVGTSPGGAYYSETDLTEFSLLMPDPIVDEEVSIRTLIGMRKTLQALYSDGWFCACYSYCPCQTDIDISISGGKK